MRAHNCWERTIPNGLACNTSLPIRYFRTYGARVDHFADHLLGLRRANGPWLAGVGYTLVAAEPLFIERSLQNAPVETEIARRLGTPVRRDQIVEVGNLAATEPGAARRVIICMTALLNQVERTWVVFTSTRSLLNDRAEIPTMTLARSGSVDAPTGQRHPMGQLLRHRSARDDCQHPSGFCASRFQASLRQWALTCLSIRRSLT